MRVPSERAECRPNAGTGGASATAFLARAALPPGLPVANGFVLKSVAEDGAGALNFTAASSLLPDEIDYIDDEEHQRMSDLDRLERFAPGNCAVRHDRSRQGVCRMSGAEPVVGN